MRTYEHIMFVSYLEINMKKYIFIFISEHEINRKTYLSKNNIQLQKNRKKNLLNHKITVFMRFFPSEMNDIITP